MSIRVPISAVLACAGLGSPVAAAAQASPVAVELELGVVSDYRFRGLSLSDEQPALQAGVTATLANGAYGYVWGSTIDEYGAGADGKGAKVEVDMVLGWAGSLGGLDLDASAQIYAYPGGTDVTYVEFPLTVSRAAGAWRWTLGAAYAPAQTALDDRDNGYGWAALAWEGAPVQVSVRAGYEDGAYAPSGKWDWSVGVSRAFGPVTAGLAYVDSDDAAGSAGIVASLTATF